MKVIYVAGPFRGKDSWEMENNIRRAEALALDVWRTGYFAALCPHTNTRFFQGAAPDKVWLEGDLELLRRCDAVVLTADWKRSSGARNEVREALFRGIPVFPDLFELVHWYRQVPSVKVSWTDLERI
jgi:nucleoside 2-deoxyribosyltransferase